MGALKYTAGLKVAIGATTTVELPPRCFRGKLHGMLFDTGKAFVLPGAMKGIRALKRFYDEHPGLEVLVVGHTDARGDEDDNLALSVERAEAMAAFLRDDVDAWMRWFDAPRPKRWGAREVQHMLSVLTDGDGQFWRGRATGGVGTAMAAAVRRFQSWQSLAVDGVAGPETRRALVRAYMGLDETTLPEGTRLVTHGCGEYHPIVDKGEDAAVDENRRVEIFLFEGPITPAASSCAHPGCAEYAAWSDAVIEEIDLCDAPSDAVGTVTFRLVDDQGKRLANRKVTIEGPDGLREDYPTDDQGEVRLSGGPRDSFKLIEIASDEASTDGVSAVTVAKAA